jgi:hypothetical protein
MPHAACCGCPFQALAFDEPHAVEGLALVLAHFVNGDNIRVVQLGGGFGFEAKPLDERRVRKPAMQQQLEGHHAINGQLAGPVYHAHSTTPDLAQ